MDKSPDAFRTISEVAEALETPAHVLRFWESRFPQIRPVKRAGGRRYYRPSDVALLTGIKRLLHDEGMTIRGVQKILREQGVRHVAGLSEEISPEEEALEAAMLGRLDVEEAPPPAEAEAETAAALEAALRPAEDGAQDGAGPAEDSATSQTAPGGGDGPDALPEDAAADAGGNQAALDWLASLPRGRDSAATPREDDTAEPVYSSAASQAEDAADTAPAVAVEAASPGDAPAPPVPPAEASAAGIDDATATLAARLRALPIGSLAGRQEDLAGIAERIARLRQRLSGHAPPG